MLDMIKIENFKSITLSWLMDTTFTVITGANATGKITNRIVLKKEFDALQRSFLNQGINTIDIETFDKHINVMGSGYFNYTSGYKKDQELLLSNGFLVALIDYYASNKQTANKAISHLLELNVNKYPSNQIRRYRKKFNNFMHNFLLLVSNVYNKDAQEISAQFSKMLEQFFRVTYWQLKNKKLQVKLIDCPDLLKKILKLIKQPFDLAFKEVLLAIKRHHLRSYCPI